MATFNEAVARLSAGYWNSNPFHATTNPGGMGAGADGVVGTRAIAGGRTVRNWDAYLEDLAAIGQGVADLAASADGDSALAHDYAVKTDGYVTGTDNSAKSWAQGGTGDGQPAAGSAKDWATKTSGAVADGEFSAKKHAQDAATAAGAALAAESGAAIGAATALAAAASIGFSDVVYLTSASSPYAVVQGTSGKMLSIDTSGGNVVINLPEISTLVLPFILGVQKATDDANTVTVNRAGTDTFNPGGAASKVISGQLGTTLIPDTDQSPDQWTAADWGGQALSGLHSVQISSGSVSLVGDEAAPGNDKVYGTDGAGSRGWQSAPAGTPDFILQNAGVL